MAVVPGLAWVMTEGQTLALIIFFLLSSPKLSFWLEDAVKCSVGTPRLMYIISGFFVIPVVIFALFCQTVMLWSFV